MLSPSRRGSGGAGTNPATERLTRAERRDQLLDSASAIVSEAGFEGVTMEGVAARAGVSKALPYQHFENSADLISALRDRELAWLTARVVEAVVPAAGLEGKVTAAVHAWFEAAKDHAGTLATFLRWLPQFEVAVHKQPSKQTPFDWFLAEVFEREVGLPRRQARVAQRFVVMGLVGALDAWTEGHAGQAAIERQVAAMIIASVTGLTTPQK